MPTNLEFSDGPNENNAKIYQYLKNLTIDNAGLASGCYIGYDTDSIMFSGAYVANLFEDGTFQKPDFGGYE